MGHVLAPATRGKKAAVCPRAASHPDILNQTTRSRKGRRCSCRGDVFTEEEQRLLRAALKTGRSVFGTWPTLAEAMRASHSAVQLAARGRRRVTAELAVRLARALRVSLDALMCPGLRLAPFPKVCPTCGRGQP